MSNFPNNIDDDTTLPIVNDNITEIGGLAINSLRDAVFNIEDNIGTNAQGTKLSISERLGVSLQADGTLKSSAIASLGLVTLPITQDQISNTANIPESKLLLDHRTQDLFNYITDLSSDVNNALGWISVTGSKLDPHLSGSVYRHTLGQINVGSTSASYLKNKFRVLRNNTDGYTLINDINNELLAHQFADGSIFGTIQNVITNDGSSYPSNYAHSANGVFLNTSRFAVIPQTAQDLQLFAEFIDSSSIFLYGTRIQNLYTNGISKVSRSSSLPVDGYGSPLIPPTSAIAYLLNTGTSGAPFDDINTGDDIIELKPNSSDMADNSFDAKFALVKPGDVIRINYGTLEVPFIIKEKKYIQGSGNKKYIVRIAGKNLFYSTIATARIDRSLINGNKFGVLAVAAANNNFAQLPSLIIGSPRGAQALGIGFNPDQLDSTHYLLYLVLYPTGNPADGYTILPSIDVTGNKGITPGLYTLESVVQATNDAFRRSGYNYRFIAFSYQGNFGIMLADSCNNAGFSIINAIVNASGEYDQTNTVISFPNNVIGMFGASPPDALGFGPFKGAIASPPYMSVYGSPESALNPTKLYLPLNRNNYYINGTEKDKLTLEVNQVLDTYGDGYWVGTVVSQNIVPGLNGRVQTTYRIPYDLCTSNLKIGKSIVVQSVGEGTLVDFGRFLIQDVTFVCDDNKHTDITVYDAVHAAGISPVPVLEIGSEVGIYFNSDSVAFNMESATDFNPVAPFKRHFEVYVDEQGRSFTHERARINISNTTLVVNNVPVFTDLESSKLDILSVSPKLTGYQFGSLNKITLNLSYDSSSGILDGYLGAYDGFNFTKIGQRIYGRKGEIIRFYDESNIDYIDIKYDINLTLSDMTNTILDFQLFPSLQLDEQIMILATCQVNDTTSVVSNIRDARQFGNTSEKDLSTSALNLISLPEKLLHFNGVIKGFELSSTPSNGQVSLKGGVALVNGKILQINQQTVNIPSVKELNGTLYNINWALCINDKGEYQCIPLLDYDPILGTPNDPTRLFRVYNVVSGNLYFIDAVTFSDLTSNRPDLTVLYIVSSIVSNTPSISISLTDCRRFVDNETFNIPLTLVSSSSGFPGNFTSFESAINWVGKFGTNTNTVVIKGEHNLTSPISLINLQKPITFKGENATLNITSSNGFLVNKNVTFENIKFNYNPSTFTNSNMLNGGNGCIYGSSNFNITDITIKNCHFASLTADHPPFICFHTTREQYIDTVKITDNYFEDLTSTNDPAIAFINDYESSNFTYMPTIANILIDQNICNANQLIFLASTFTTNDNPGMASINVRITNNTCGFIGYCISGHRQHNINVRGIKQSSLLIENNSAVAILSPVSHLGTVSSLELTHPSGNVNIVNNSLNNITIKSFCAAVSDGYGTGILSINNNQFSANSFALLSPFMTVTTMAGIIISRSSSNVLSDIAINIIGNTLNTGTYNSTVYKYDYGINISNLSCNISENNILSLNNGTGTYGIFVTGGLVGMRVKINDNSIARGTAIINKYILASGLGIVGEIIGNFLDSTTTDGVSENTIASSNTDVDKRIFISRNKNHINTISLRLRDAGKIVYEDVVYGDFVEDVNADHPFLVKAMAVDGPLEDEAGQLQFKVLADTVTHITVYWVINLASVLPLESAIINLSISGGVPNNANVNNGGLTLSLTRKAIAPAEDDVLATTSFNWVTYIDPGVLVADLTATPNGNPTVVESLYALIKMNMKAEENKTMYVSPLTIKYRY